MNGDPSRLAAFRCFANGLAACVALGCTSLAALAGTTTVSVSGAAGSTNGAAQVVNFPVARTGDTSYDAVVRFHTIDGTAVAPADYAAATGAIVIPAGSASGSIPVTLAPNTSGDEASPTFRVQLDAAFGIGPQPSIATFGTAIIGSTSNSVAIADVNADGRSDLIMARTSGAEIAVSLAISNGFVFAQNFTTGAAPSTVIAADINGDGRPDAITANTNSNNVSVLLNTTPAGETTTPTYSTHQTFATEVGPFGVAAADINGDGRPDLVATNRTSQTASVLLNTTAPGAVSATFATQQSFAAGNSPTYVVTADMNGDGRPDVLLANFISNRFSVLLNATDPGSATVAFAARQSFIAGLQTFSVFAADVNGDGKPDAITANRNSNSVSVFANTTTPGGTVPTFAAEQAFGTGAAPAVAIAADMNGDGKPDLIVGNNGEDTVSVLRNITAPGSMTPSFGAQQAFNVGSGPQSLATGDFNFDGKPDLAVAKFNFGDTLSVHFNTTAAPTATPDFAGQEAFAVGVSAYWVATADLNGDGKRDLAATNYDFTTRAVSVLLGTTTPGAAAPTFNAHQDFATDAIPRGMGIADLNGDGRQDLLAANTGANTASVLLNTTTPGAASASFGAQQSFVTGAFPYTAIAADMNLDGRADMVVADEGSASASVFLNNTVPGAAAVDFAARQAVSLGSLPASAIAVDVNLDGKPDLACSDIGNGSIAVRLNTTAPGAATVSFGTMVAFSVGVGPTDVIAADVNGDALPDLIAPNLNDDTVTVLINLNNPLVFAPSFAGATFPSGDDSTGVATADIDGDGRLDLVVSNYNGNNASVLLNTTAPRATTPSFGPPQPLAAGTNPTYVAVTDVNGDGRPDPIVANFTSATLSVLPNTQYRGTISGDPATGTIFHANLILRDGFE